MPGRYSRVPRRMMGQTAGVMGQTVGVAPSNFNFWEVDGRTFYSLSPQLCQDMIDQVLEAMQKALTSGVVEYKIGSRGLKRFTMKDLQDLLGYWLNQLEAATWGGSIVARRACPTDS